MKPIKIVVVEDNSMELEEFWDRLEQHFALQVEDLGTSDSVAGGLELIRRKNDSIDLIVLDHELNDGATETGLQLYNMLMGSHPPLKAKVLVVSSKKDNFDQWEEARKMPGNQIVGCMKKWPRSKDFKNRFFKIFRELQPGPKPVLLKKPSFKQTTPPNPGAISNQQKRPAAIPAQPNKAFA